MNRAATETESCLGSGPRLTTAALVGVVHAVRVPVALEALGNAVAAAALEVAGLAGPQLCYHDDTRTQTQTTLDERRAAP